MISFSITENATPALQRMVRQCANPLPGLKAAATGVSELLRGHFKEKNETPNRLGGQRTNYWLEVRHSVKKWYALGPRAVTLAVTHPTFCQKVFGGVIKAKNWPFLTVPIHAEAHGKKASVVARAFGSRLFRLATPGRPVQRRGTLSRLLGALGVRRQSYQDGDILAGKRDGKLVKLYVLKESVNQPPDPTALPPETEMRQTAQQAFGEWLEREKQKAEKAPPVKR